MRGQRPAPHLTSVLVFSATTGYRHASIPYGIDAIRALGAANGFSVVATEDPGAFSTAGLAGHQAVVWLSTSGDVLDAAQRDAFRSYIAAGGGYVGVHSAAATEYGWAWYGGLVGAHLAGHPPVQRASLRVEDRSTDGTAHLPQAWVRTDEWYDFRTNPRARVRVLMSVDESSYAGGSMAGDHPITWCQTYDGGRAWYTGLGHTARSYREPDFTRMLLGGIRMAAGADESEHKP